jgi:hypothetical protein
MPVQLNQYFSLQYNPGPGDGGRRLPVSRAKTPKWVTIPWNTLVHNPEKHISLGGWTLLYGKDAGCHFNITAHVRVQRLVPNCSVHVRLYEVEIGPDGGETRVLDRSAIERPVLPLESSNTHIDGQWSGFLSPGRRLRCEVDYWGRLARHGAAGIIVFAGINGFYGRPTPTPSDPPETAP